MARKVRKSVPIGEYCHKIARPRMRLRWQLFWYALLIIAICIGLAR